MTDLVEKVKLLERKAELFDNLVDEIMMLKRDIAEFEKDETSVRPLVCSLKNLIAKYESSSREFLSNLERLGYQEGKLKKYVDSTFDGERIISVKANIDGEVYVNTDSGQHFVCTFGDTYNYTQSLDYIMCDIQDTTGLELRK